MSTDVLLAFVLMFGLVVDETDCSWSYRDDNGPKYWLKNYKYCSSDIQNQSPIDIPRSSGRTYDKDLQTLEFINYDQEIKAEAKNDGSNIRFQKIYTTIDRKIYIYKGSLDIGVKYIASEFNFHWSLYDKDEKRIESGHRLEGKKFPMELHIIHYRDDYDSLDKAKDYHDGVATVVFFIKQGEEVNVRYHPLTKYLEELKFKARDARTVVDIEGFSLKDITNKDIKVSKDSGKHLHYYYYEGTSTSPPCHHAKWFVFKDPVELDEFQINLFRNMKRVKEDGSTDDAYDKMGPNFRPVQDLAGRKVYESDDSSGSSSSIITAKTACFWSFRDDNGPKYWAKNYKDCSGDIQNQSPIDIPESSRRTYDKDLQTLEFINYGQEIKAEAKNDGSYIRFQKIFTSTDQKIYISKGNLGIGVKYTVSELHFQWSLYNEDEEKIESGHRLEGKKFPMELHILHYRDDYDSLDKAKDYPDGVVIVVFFITQGEEVNERYHPLTEYLEELKFKPKDDKTVVDIAGFSLKAITNKDLKVSNDSGKHLHYYYYEGTSTTPPCHHAKWFVFKDPVELGEFQINLFRGMKRVMKDGSTDDAYDKMGPNFRPVQDLAGRKVYESDDSSSSEN